MKCGNKYSTFINRGYSKLKKFKRDIKLGRINLDFGDEMIKMSKKFEGDIIAEREFVSLLSLLENEQTEFYISKDLYKFLINLNIKDLKALNYTYFWDRKFMVKDDSGNEVKFNIGKINIWNKERSILFMLCNHAGINKKELFTTDGDEMIIANISEDYNDSLDSHIFKLVFNLLLYIECYPTLVLNEAPEWFKKINKNEYNITIKDHVDLCGKEMSPHFRSGHFRRLTSDYYKNKRGQVVYIKSTFVKKENQYNVIDKERTIAL